MRFSYSWVSEYLENPPDIHEMARLLNETGLETDVVDEMLEVEHTVNRPDAMSHFGIAREIAVKLGRQPVLPPLYEGELPNGGDWSISSTDTARCWRYLLLEVDQVKACESPSWLRSRLEEIGQTCHNDLVDLTNFLLWEFGHPSHGFDAQKLQGKKIHVRLGEKGETLRTLDGKMHDAEGHLCITDAKGPVAFAGIMGGENSEVDEGTNRLVLELAVFQPKGVRLSGRQLNIESDARHRFERGVDEEFMEKVVRRFIHLLKKTQPSIKLVCFQDMALQPFTRSIIELRKQRLDQILGVKLDEGMVTELLKSMDFQPEKTSTGWRVSTPGYKVDVQREIDVIEEIIRFAGLDNLESTLPVMAGTSFTSNPMGEGKAYLHNLMPSLGFQETCTYSFLSPELENRFGRGPEPVALRNPMTENQAVLRRSMLPSLMECVRRNHNRGNGSLAFYEIGRVFLADKEPIHFAAVISELTAPATWWGNAKVHPFHKLKGVLDVLLEKWGNNSLLLGELNASDPAFELRVGVFHGATQVGFIGILSDEECAHWDFLHPVAVLEIDLAFLGNITSSVPVIEPLAEYPGMRIDMAFVLDQAHLFQDVKKHILGLNPENLQELSLFDVYQGKGIAKGKRSLGMRFRFQNKHRTLTGEEVSGTMAQVVSSVKAAFGAEIRE